MMKGQKNFEHKGSIIKIGENKLGEKYFLYNNGEKDIPLPFSEIKKFIESPFSNTTLNGVAIDKIPKSIKIDKLIISEEEIKRRFKQFE